MEGEHHPPYSSHKKYVEKKQHFDYLKQHPNNLAIYSDYNDYFNLEL